MVRALTSTNAFLFWYFNTRYLPYKVLVVLMDTMDFGMTNVVSDDDDEE